MAGIERSVIRISATLFAFALASACAPDDSAPLSLYGEWVADDERYAGRTLEIGIHSLRFLDGHQELDSVRIVDIDAEREPGTPERFVISGEARDGEDVELVLVVQAQPVELLRFETQTGTWRRAADGHLVGMP